MDIDSHDIGPGFTDHHIDFITWLLFPWIGFTLAVGVSGAKLGSSSADRFSATTSLPTRSLKHQLIRRLDHIFGLSNQGQSDSSFLAYRKCSPRCRLSRVLLAGMERREAKRSAVKRGS